MLAAAWVVQLDNSTAEEAGPKKQAPWWFIVLCCGAVIVVVGWKARNFWRWIRS